MKFGVASIITDESIGPETLATALEQRSFDSMWVGDHPHVPCRRETPFPFGGDLPREFHREYDPFVSLAAAAVVTTTLTLGTGVLLAAQRDVFYTAKQVASVDRLSDGRFVFGVGAGWIREETRNHGVDPATRGRRLDEHLAALDALWTQSEAEFHGTFLDFDPVYSWPKPVQAHVPVYVGGESVASVRRAGARGDAWMPNAVQNAALVKAQFALRDLHAPGTPLTAYAVVADNLPLVEAYMQFGAEQIVFYLPTLPTADALKMLDSIEAVVARLR
jgi:probable F420-dependent oxidoreductase